MTSITRRRLLRTGALGLVSVTAGCSDGATTDPSQWSPVATTRQPTATSTRTRTPTAHPETAAPHLGDFVLWNDDDTPHVLSLTVHRSDVHVLTIERRLEPGASTRVSNPVDRQGRYLIEASLDTNRRRRLRWRIEACSSVEYVQCYVDSEGRLGLRTLRRTVDPPPTCE